MTLFRTAALGLMLATVSLVSQRALGAPPPRTISIVVHPKAAPPVMFGVAELEKALAEKGWQATRVAPGAKIAGPAITLPQLRVEGVDLDLNGWLRARESFGIARTGQQISVTSIGDVGKMYGLLDLAEQIQMMPRIANVIALAKEKSAAPHITYRGTNPFLHVEALADPNSWIYSEDFWRGYLDQMARARLNFLDIHATYGLRSTGFPNVFPYLVKTDQFPEIGVPAADAERNLATLNRVIQMAHDRGILVGLMSYTASIKIPLNDNPPYPDNSETRGKYIREAVAALMKGAPGLDFIGYRIGESGEGEEFYNRSFVDGVKAGGRPIRLYTRTWGAKRDPLVRLSELSPGATYLEIKYNGEHLGVPYIIPGGRMTHSYSYQDYGRLPRKYDIIWQIRANGTHRIFPWGDPDFVRRTVEAVPLVGAVGFCAEPMSAYYPWTNYYLKDPAKREHCFQWTYERDWFWDYLFGRLAYDPQTPESVWINMFQRRWGKAGEEVYRAYVSMSKIVPTIWATHCLGPDHRNMAPEMEMGGPIEEFVKVRPADVAVIQDPQQYVDNLKAGRGSGRAAPTEMGALLAAAAANAQMHMRKARAQLSGPSQRFECLDVAVNALAELARYYDRKMAAGVALGRHLSANDWADYYQCQRLVDQSHGHWAKLAEITDANYLPVIDTLRMHTMEFTWKAEGEKLARDLEVLDRLRRAGIDAVPSKEQPPKMGHFPLAQALPAEATRLTCSAAHNSGIKAVTLRYQSSAGGGEKSVSMQPVAGQEWVYRAIIPAEDARAGTVTYSITAERPEAGSPGGERTSTSGPHVINISADRKPPRITNLRDDHKRAAPKTTVSAQVSDDDEVGQVTLWWRPLPSGEGWQSMAMTPAGGEYRATVPVTSDGILYYVEAVDRAGNGAQYPDFRNEQPYRVIPPWPTS